MRGEIDLPRRGHAATMDRNSDEIAARVRDWLSGRDPAVTPLPWPMGDWLIAHPSAWGVLHEWAREEPLQWHPLPTWSARRSPPTWPRKPAATASVALEPTGRALDIPGAGGPVPPPRPGGQHERSARDALDSFDEAMVWDDESKLELACRFVDEQGLLDEFKAFLREQAENEADDGD